MDIPDDTVIQSKAVSKAIENAQKNIEGNNFEARKNLIGFDDVINKQRIVIYEQRNIVLENEAISDEIEAMINFVAADIVKTHLEENIGVQDNIEEIYKENVKSLLVAAKAFSIEESDINEDELLKISLEGTQELFKELFMMKYEYFKYSFEKNEFDLKEREILLSVVDEKWIDHLDNMEHLKEGIKLRSYRQEDPVVAFKLESSEAFNDMIKSIKYEVVRRIITI